MENKKNYFTELYSIDVSSKVEKKNGLSYLSWAWAWAELKKIHPTATYTIYENSAGCFYHTDGLTAWVKTGVTVDGVEHIEYLPVMDFKNKSIPVGNITSFDVNKAIQRSLTKAVARHGLGLCIYAGEDLPETETEAKPEPVKAEAKPKKAKATIKATEPASPEHSNVRGELVKFCNDNGIDLKVICKMYKLNNDTPEQTFREALSYCKSEVKKRDLFKAEEAKKPTDELDATEQLLNDFPMEV